MDRALYPDTVEVDNSALEYTESTKIEQILDRTLAMAQPGVIVGLNVTVNTVNNTLIDVAPGVIIVPNAEQAIVATAAVGVALADNTNGVVNVVIATYTETDSQPEPSEDGLSTEETKVISAGVVSVITQAAYDALLPAQLAVTGVIAKITATGAAISPTLIIQSVSFINVLAPSQPSAIAGVIITNIDFTTNPGNGQLDFDASPPNLSDPLVPAPRIRWTAPGEAGPGVYVNIPTNGSYVLSSLGGHTLTISVISVNLPIVDVVETIVVESLYTKTIPRFTSADLLHRTYIGSGAPSEKNPHGMTFADLGGSPNQQVEEHQLLMHSNGIKRGSNGIFLFTSVIPVAGPSPDYLSITGPISGDVYFVNGINLLTITNTQVTFLTSVSSSYSLYDIIIDFAGNPGRALRVQHPISPNVSGVVIIDIDEKIGTSTNNLVWNRTTKQLSWGGGTSVLIRADGNYTLYDTQGRWVIANVALNNVLGYGILPSSGGPTFTDSVQVFDHVSRKLNYQIAYCPWDGSNSLGWTTLISNPRQATDKRLFGITSLTDLRDDVLLADVELKSATYVVGDGVTTFGDFNGGSGINAAVAALLAASATGTIAVMPGTYDPIIISASVHDVSIIGVGNVFIDGISTGLTASAISMSGNRIRLKNLRLANAVTGITSTGGGGHNRGYSLVYEASLISKLTWISGDDNVYVDFRQSRTVSGDTVLTPFDDIVIVDAVSGPVNITMPLAVNCIRPVMVKKKDFTANAVTILASGSDAINYGTLTGTDVSMGSLTLEPITGGWIT